MSFNKKEFTTFLKSLERAHELTYVIGDSKETLNIHDQEDAVETYRQVLSEANIIDLKKKSTDPDESESSKLIPDLERSE